MKDDTAPVPTLRGGSPRLTRTNPSPSLLRSLATMTRLHGDDEPRRSRGRLLHTEPRRPPPSPPTFEFVHIIGSEMCAAEDVFHRGQLLPYKPPPPAFSPASTRSPTQPPPTADREHRRCPSEGHPRRHRRAESLDGYERGAGVASRYWRTKGSLSADYQRLRPVAEEACNAKAGPRAAGAGGGAPSPRPKWYVLVFGSVRVPAEMDMRDIKSRLRRRSSDSLRAGSSGSAKTTGGGGGGGGGAWKLLRSLSCKGDVGDVVDAPLRSYGFT